MLVASIALSIAALIALPAVWFLAPPVWGLVLLSALCLALIALCAATATLSLVAGMRLRALSGLAGWTPGGAFRSMGREDAGSTVCRCLDEERTLIQKDADGLDAAARLLVISDGLFMGALLVGLVAVVAAFVFAVLAVTA